MNIIKNKKFEEERSLYALKDTTIDSCIFSSDSLIGESPLKESDSIRVINSTFDLRYPLWHNRNSIIENTTFSNTSRAPFWYASNSKIINSQVFGVKFLRECKDIEILNSMFTSDEFGWKCENLKMSDSSVESSYPFFETHNLELNNVNLKGKYSFQYVSNLKITNSYLDTKDAFWHTENAVIENTTIKGEYLAWFAKNLTFINCKIIGTQPICYSENIVFKNCIMEDADLAFENSIVDIDINSDLISIKNPISGKIVCNKINEIIFDDNKKPGKVEIVERSKQ